MAPVVPGPLPVPPLAAPLPAPPAWRLRRAVPSDARAIHEAHMASIVESCARDYTPAQIDAWGRRPLDEAARVAAIVADVVWVVVVRADTDASVGAGAGSEVSSEVEGFGRLAVGGSPGTAEVTQLYLRRRAQGCGAGKALLRTLEACALARGAERVKLNASRTAHPFYLSQGYVGAGPMVAFPLPSGVAIESSPLIKDLTAGTTTHPAAPPAEPPTAV